MTNWAEDSTSHQQLLGMSSMYLCQDSLNYRLCEFYNTHISKALYVRK